MKKVVFPFLGILALGLSGCIDNGDKVNVSSYVEVAIVEEFDMTAGGQPALITPNGKVIVPELRSALSSNLLYDGAAVLAYFSIYENRQVSTNYTIASNVDYQIINQVKAYATSGGESIAGDFDVKIEKINEAVGFSIGDYKAFIFIAFVHEAPTDQKFDYEMTYDLADTDVIYVRAKKNGSGTNNSSTFAYLYAFDVSDFIALQGENKGTFKIKYKTGEEDGKDVYGEYNPPY